MSDCRNLKITPFVGVRFRFFDAIMLILSDCRNLKITPFVGVRFRCYYATIVRLYEPWTISHITRIIIIIRRRRDAHIDLLLVFSRLATSPVVVYCGRDNLIA